MPGELILVYLFLFPLGGVKAGLSSYPLQSISALWVKCKTNSYSKVAELKNNAFQSKTHT